MSIVERSGKNIVFHISEHLLYSLGMSKNCSNAVFHVFITSLNFFQGNKKSSIEKLKKKKKKSGC